jgi:predicted nicotinamide N-methyase
MRPRLAPQVQLPQYQGSTTTFHPKFSNGRSAKNIKMQANLNELLKALRRTLPSSELEISRLDEVPNIRLALIKSNFPTGPLPEQVMRDVIAKPAYWAFCWGSGLALAKWLIDNPAVVKNKRVADIGSGSGVVAIAAKQAGAAKVWACDNDKQALLATKTNAELNHTDIQLCADIDDLPKDLDLILMADVLYDRSNFALLEKIKALNGILLIADSRIATIDDPDFSLFHQAEALTLPNLGEFDEFKSVRFFVTGSPDALLLNSQV